MNEQLAAAYKKTGPKFVANAKEFCLSKISLRTPLIKMDLAPTAEDVGMLDEGLKGGRILRSSFERSRSYEAYQES